MGVAGADETELVGVRAALGLELQAALVGVADVGAARPRLVPLRDPVGHDLEVGPLIVRRQEGVGVGGALDLGDLDQRLVPHPGLGVGGVDRLAGEVHELEHVAVGAVRVVGDGQRLDPLRTLVVHPGPEIFRVRRVEAAERVVRHGVAPEDHVAVQVAPLAARRVLVGRKRREGAGIVVALSRLDGPLPGGADDVHVAVLPDVGAAAEGVPLLRDRSGLGEVGRSVELRQRVVGLRHRFQHAEVVRVVGDGKEIKRSVELEVEPSGMLDRLALGEFIGVVGRAARAEDEGVERVAGVDVQIPEERSPVYFFSGRHGGAAEAEDDCGSQDYC